MLLDGFSGAVRLNLLRNEVPVELHTLPAHDVLDAEQDELILLSCDVMSATVEWGYFFETHGSSEPTYDPWRSYASLESLLPRP